MLNQLGSEQAAIVGNIDPDAYAASTVTTGWISAKLFHTYMAILMLGDLVSTATVDAKIEQATDSSGTGAKDVTGKAITQLTQAGSDDNKQAIINLRQEDLDGANDFDHFRLSSTLGTAGGDLGATVLGFGPRYGPANDNDASTVDEIVS